jgi:SAM-dependent methyltransferase
MPRESQAPSARDGLHRLHALKDFEPRAFTDTSDSGFICTHLIERSIALLAGEFQGALLDVGCGQQPYRSYFSHVKNHRACDFDATRGDVDFACPAHQIPLADESLDSILCTEVLEHVPDPLAVWCEFHRLLRPGGKVLLTTPMYWPPHELPYDFYRYPEHGLRHLISQSGFELQAIIPRGGPWALWGQVTLHVMSPLMPFRWQRRIWNRMMLYLDRKSKTPRLTSGWTVLAEKPRAQD